MLGFLLRLTISGKIQTKLFSPYYFLVTFSFKSCVALFFWMKVWQFHKLCLLPFYKTKHERSQGRRLCNSSFFSGGTCLTATGSFSEASVLVVCVSQLAVLTRLYACQMQPCCSERWDCCWLSSSASVMQSPDRRGTTWSILPPAYSRTGLHETAKLMLKSC